MRLQSSSWTRSQSHEPERRWAVETDVSGLQFVDGRSLAPPGSRPGPHRCASPPSRQRRPGGADCARTGCRADVGQRSGDVGSRADGTSVASGVFQRSNNRAILPNVMPAGWYTTGYTGSSSGHYLREERPVMSGIVPSFKVRSSARELGQNLANMRKLQRFTAQQVADRAGISRGTLRRLEAGETTVGFEAVLSVCRVVGLLDQMVSATDPLRTPLGQAIALDQLPKRVRR